MSPLSFILSTRGAFLFVQLFIVASYFFKELEAVRVVALNVPSQVRKGAEVELSCLYDLGNASLYSLKWFYRANETDLDEQEFFRYTPSIKPHKQYFPIEGIKVNVNKSQGGRVVIVETNGKTTGKYKCEISIEGTFQTVAAEKLMTVLGNAAKSSATRPSVWTTNIFLWMLLSLLIGYFHVADFNNSHNWSPEVKLKRFQQRKQAWKASVSSPITETQSTHCATQSSEFSRTTNSNSSRNCYLNG